MKKLIIATSILFAFSATFAQEAKPSKKTPMSSKAPTSVSSNEAKPNMKPNVKPNVKPVGKTSTKPAPVVSKVSPVKGAKPVGPSTNRAASSNVNTARPEKVNNNRAASSSAVNTSKAEKATNNRAASSSAVNTSKAEKANNNKTSTKGEKGEVSESAMNTEVISKKPDADYCKGWKEGYVKAFSKATGEKISFDDVPNCVAQGDCEGYKCGYAAGVRNAERRIK